MATTLTLLVVEDDQNDQELLQEALDEIGFEHRVVYLDDGEELVAYVNREQRYADRDRFPDPSVILLDLHMPRKGGWPPWTSSRAPSASGASPWW